MRGVCAGNLAASIPPSLRFGAASSEQLFLSRLRVHGRKAPALHRFRFKVQQITFLWAGFEDEDENEDDPASVF